MTYFRPETLTEALDIVRDNEVRIAAGCTDLFPATAKQWLDGPTLDITGIDEMKGVTHSADGIRIGSATTWTDIIRAELPGSFDALKQAAAEVGGVQIQNAGTIGGNICNASPAADGVPALLALDARVRFQSAEQTRTVPISDFITGVRTTALRHGEIVSAILFPNDSPGQSVFLKLGSRKHLVISIVMAAVNLHVKDGLVKSAAISIGACSPAAIRLTEVERALTGAEADQNLPTLVSVEAVSSALSPIGDIRADADYRKDFATVLIRRALGHLTDTNRLAA